MIAALLLAWATAAAAQTFTLDASTGSLRGKLFRDGPLAAFGRDHVVAAPAFAGTVELSSASATLSMTVDARALKVVEEDQPAEFQAYVLGPGALDVQRYPEIALVSQSIEPVPEEKDVWHLIGRLSLRGAEQTIEAPVTMTEGPDGGRWLSGYVRLRQSDFGIKPYSAFLGAVRLRDDVVVSFSLLARPERR